MKKSTLFAVIIFVVILLLSIFLFLTIPTFNNNDKKTLKMYINGELNKEFSNYEFKDLDKILISYGNEDEKQIKKQIDSVTDKACIQSEKCPERGLPTPEASCSSNEICTVG